MFSGFSGRRGVGFGTRGGMGFGFRGSSPPWPYVGIGRGGLPRCGYFLSDAGAPFMRPYQHAPYPLYASGYAPPTAQVTKEEELDFLKDQAGVIKEQLKEIESRIEEVESKKE